MDAGIMLLIFLGLLITGMPIAFSAASTALVCFVCFDVSSLTTLASRMYGSLSNFTLVAMPLFILLGVILGRANLIKYIFDLANSLLRNIPGGLGVAAIITSAVFAAICGASLANAAALGMILFPYMLKSGYKADLTCGILAVGGTLGILIPPSVTMILYGALTEQSVGQLFMSGLIPGIVAMAILALFTMFWAGKKVKTEKKPLNRQEFFSAFKVAFPILLAPIIIIGGIYFGWFTPDESAAIAVFYCSVIGFLIYKTLKVKELIGILTEAAAVSGQIMLILAGVMALGFVITLSRVSHQLAEWIISLDLSPMVFMIAVNILLIIMGCFLDVTSVMLITIPILYPVFMTLGFHPIHLAVIYTVNMEIGTITPPVGMNLFAISSTTGTPIGAVAKGVFPYILVMIIIMAVVIAFPELSTWLPSKMY